MNLQFMNVTIILLYSLTISVEHFSCIYWKRSLQHVMYLENLKLVLNYRVQI